MYVFVYLYVFTQCVDSCAISDESWNSAITVVSQGTRYIHIMWTADTQSSLYVVQYRLTNTQVYTSSLEVRMYVALKSYYSCMSVHTCVHVAIVFNLVIN